MMPIRTHESFVTSPSSSWQTVSVVIPAYRSEASIPLLAEKLHEVLPTICAHPEIIFVDDCSPDGTWEALKRVKQKYGSTVKIIQLLTNSGQHNATLCGLSFATGQVVVTMDDDLQNPPEEIPKLVGAIEEGYDLAIAAYDSKKHSSFRNAGGRFVDSTLRSIFHLPGNFQLTSFRAAKDVVVMNVCQMGGVFPYVTAMMFSHASRYVNVPVRHDARLLGHSNYTMKRSLLLAANLIFSYSSYPLSVIIGLSTLAFLISMLFGFWTLYRALQYGISVPGWASTVVIVSFFNAITLFCFTVFGVYLSRISQQLTKSKQPFTVRDLQE